MAAHPVADMAAVADTEVPQAAAANPKVKMSCLT
jgi:hypothetical protein